MSTEIVRGSGEVSSGVVHFHLHTLKSLALKQGEEKPKKKKSGKKEFQAVKQSVKCLWAKYFGGRLLLSEVSNLPGQAGCPREATACTDLGSRMKTHSGVRQGTPVSTVGQVVTQSALERSFHWSASDDCCHVRENKGTVQLWHHCHHFRIH